MFILEYYEQLKKTILYRLLQFVRIYNTKENVICYLNTSVMKSNMYNKEYSFFSQLFEMDVLAVMFFHLDLPKHDV